MNPVTSIVCIRSGIMCIRSGARAGQDEQDGFWGFIELASISVQAAMLGRADCLAIAKAEGARLWLRVLSELKDRGLHDMLIAVVDGLTGFAEAIATIFPKTEMELCIVHMVERAIFTANAIEAFCDMVHKVAKNSLSLRLKLP